MNQVEKKYDKLSKSFVTYMLAEKLHKYILLINKNLGKYKYFFLMVRRLFPHTKQLKLANKHLKTAYLHQLKSILPLSC